MGPVSLVAYRQQRVALPPLLQWLSWERNWVQTHKSVSQCAVDYVGSPFFSEAVALSIVVDDFMKGCYTLTM
jgi:hypothetical protein